jgi:thiamine monophosphate kinase
VFHTGEEYEIVFTVPAKYKSKINSIAKTTKTPIIEIGKVIKGTGVFVQKDKLVKLKDLGYHHFK